MFFEYKTLQVIFDFRNVFLEGSPRQRLGGMGCWLVARVHMHCLIESSQLCEVNDIILALQTRKLKFREAE